MSPRSHLLFSPRVVEDENKREMGVGLILYKRPYEARPDLSHLHSSL